MELILPKRKNLRLKEYDYSQNGAYFITICVANRRCLLWNVGTIINRPLAETDFSEYGLCVAQHIKDIPVFYPELNVDKYVIMPNHIHMILSIDTSVENGGRLIIAPTNISNVVKQLKSAVTKDIGISIWQKSFFDHIIRNEQDYLAIWQYIDDNPLKWQEDEFYVKNIKEYT